MIERLLIAERGEAAVRIARACKRLGITAIALRAEQDTDEALHIDACDEAQPWVDDPAALIDVGAGCAADALHPGYAETQSLDLIRAAEEANAMVISASSEALAACADPERLRRAADAAGLRMPPAEGLDRPRRIEVVVASDAGRGFAALGEMELLLDSDGTTMIAEAPSPALLMRHDGEAIRDAMGDGSGRLLGQLGVLGVAAVTLSFDMDGHFWLEGIRPGIPLLHPPVEMITGVDLVELQLRVHTGERLDPELQRLQPSGHAFVTCVQAMGPTAEPMTEMRWPPAPHGRSRVEPSVHLGAVPEGPTLLKMATAGPVRHVALLTLDRTLAATTLAPYETNVGRLRSLLADESYRAGQYDIAFMSRPTRT